MGLEEAHFNTEAALLIDHAGGHVAVIVLGRVDVRECFSRAAMGWLWFRGGTVIFAFEPFPAVGSGSQSALVAISALAGRQEREPEIDVQQPAELDRLVAAIEKMIVDADRRLAERAADRAAKLQVRVEYAGGADHP